MSKELKEQIIHLTMENENLKNKLDMESSVNEKYKSEMERLQALNHELFLKVQTPGQAAAKQETEKYLNFDELAMKIIK